MALRLSGLSSGMDTESIVTELMKAQRLKETKLKNKITTTEWKQDKWKDLNSKIYSFYTGTLSKLKMQGNFGTKKATSSDESKVAVTANVNATAGTHKIQVKQLASAEFVTGAVLGTDKNSKDITTSTLLTDLNMAAATTNQITVTAGTTTKTLTISATSTVNDFLKTLQDAGLNASYDTAQKRFFISSKDSGYANAFSITTAGTVDLTKLGLNTITTTTNADKTVTVTPTGTNMTLVKPIDSKIVYNGVEITSSSNTVNINGLTLTLKGITDGANTSDTSDDKDVSLNITNDAQAVYDMVKDFVTKYNELLLEMNTDYDAPSTRGYDPLTDDQKESMTDDQIEKWETKIKDSLLRRDDNLSSIISEMRTDMGSNIEIDGKKYSLASIGIGSVAYTEKGQLHIDGDKDDSLVSAKTNKLMDELTKNPDKVMNILTGLADKLYTDITKDMKSSKIRSALTVYNDKEMASELKDYKDQLSVMEDKLQDMEDRYYKQFTAMEKAMAEMNSQSSSLAGLLGNNQ